MKSCQDLKTCILSLILLGLLSLMGCTSAPSKTPAQHKAVMFRADAQNSGVYQTQGVKEKPRLSWRFPIWGQTHTEPIVLNQTVMVGDDRGGVRAIDAQTGLSKWYFQVANMPHSGLISAPAVVDGVVYIGALDLYFYAVEAQTGQELWRYEVDRILSSPTVSSGIVYFEESGTESHLTALDAKTGQLLWHQPVKLHYDSAPAVAEGRVVITEPAGFVKAFDGMTGSPLWESQVGELGQVVPVMANGYVYVVSKDQHLYAIDAETGTTVWRFNAEVYASPALSEGVVYVSSFLGKLHAISGQTGEELWRFTDQQVIFTSPVIADGYLYIVGLDSNALGSGSESDQFDRYIYAFSLTGEVKWQLTTQLPIDPLMSISEGALYLSGKEEVFKFE